MEGGLTCSFNISAQRLSRTHFGNMLLSMFTEVKDRESPIAHASLPVYHIHTFRGKKQRKRAGEIFPVLWHMKSKKVHWWNIVTKGRGEIFQFNIKGAVTDESFIDLTGQKNCICADLAPNPATSALLIFTDFATCSSEESTFNRVDFLNYEKLWQRTGILP